MKAFPKQFNSLIIFTLTCLIVACSKGDDGPSKVENEQENTDSDASDGAEEDNSSTAVHLLDLATSIDDLSILALALDKIDPANKEQLSKEGDITVFAPTNTAFENLLAELEDYNSLNDFSSEEDLLLLEEIVKYHVIANEALLAAQVTNDKSYTTLQSETVTTYTTDGVQLQDKTNTRSNVIVADNQASNGIAHLVDKVLLPQAVLDALNPQHNSDKTVAELIATKENLSLLKDALQVAGLESTLNEEGPFTVFAPSDDAVQVLFDLLGEGYASFSDFDNSIEILLLQDILKYHVVNQNLLAADLEATTYATLQANQNFELVATGNGWEINDASNTNAALTEIDKLATNGVVHVINKILISPETAELLASIGIDVNDIPDPNATSIKALVEQTTELSFLQQALELTGLLDTLGEDGPYTVLAPANETIMFLSALLGNATLDDYTSSFEIDILRQVLQYHIIPENITEDMLKSGNITTLLGEPITIKNTNGTINFTDGVGLTSTLRYGNIPASNGTIHIVNNLLLPATVVDHLAEQTTSTFNALSAELKENRIVMTALLMAGDEIKNGLTAQSKFTLFLPTNAAFLNLFKSLDGIESLADFDTEAELVILSKILAYHLVLYQNKNANDFIDGEDLVSFQGEAIRVHLNGEINLIDKTNKAAKVTKTDIAFGNGTLHFIDKVLIPQAVLKHL
ncbi:fasciclin domain-containing protein [Flavobacterium sp. ASW18X]|uniref:fasciclin domain-containing protein n=1 Tax=Flavobacterium sp. ASW18X TaxID=2572595 RepID=UPI0010ADC32A|nr:fasciclin domain-containing protein [Flavobacterium sp. ASW18X]TKD57498.1 fasciclin domain-containing protein [Flavobacterium sp. ASW18X]